MAFKSPLKTLQTQCTALAAPKRLSANPACLRALHPASVFTRLRSTSTSTNNKAGQTGQRHFMAETYPHTSMKPASIVRSNLPAFQPDHFQTLVEDLSAILGPRFGIDSDECDVPALMSAMRSYESRQIEWQRYALVDRSIPYTRNLVDKGNGRSNLLLLVWNPGQGSPIHCHADAHCIMKVLSGHLKEELYEYPQESDNVRPLKLWRESLMAENQVAYMSDKLGIHRMVNPDPHRLAVSLHLYTPPKAELFGCNVFDRQGNRKTISTCGFHSEYGRKVAKS